MPVISPDVDPPVEGVIPSGDMAWRDFVGVVRATGATPGQVAAHLGGVFGEDEAKAFVMEMLGRGLPGSSALPILDDIAQTDPALAQACLAEALAQDRILEWECEGMRGMHLERRPWITGLPAGLTIRGTLYLRECVGLVTLPEGLKVRGSLNVNGCVSLTGLPHGLSVGCNLVCQDCLSLVHLHGDLVVGGWADFSDCRALADLPPGLDIPGDLVVQGCTSLSGVGLGVRVGGRLEMADCGALVRLPEDLWVRQGINLRGCSAWDGRIPPSILDDSLVWTDTTPHPAGSLAREWRVGHPWAVDHGEV